MNFVLRSGLLGELRRVPIPLLRHYYVVHCHGAEPSPAEAAELFTLATRAAAHLAAREVGRPDAYTLIYSGHASRRAAGWHLHVLLVPNRLSKAWLYLVLAGKNLLQSFGVRRSGPRRALAGAP